MATEQQAPTITLTGWVHVHTWQESHGAFVQETYQLTQTNPYHYRVQLLVVSVYRDGSPSTIQTRSDNDYLKASEIRANPDRYTKGGEGVTPCCTAGHDDFTDTKDGQLWRVYGVAGHGEWAFKITEADLAA